MLEVFAEVRTGLRGAQPAGAGQACPGLPAEDF